MEMCEKVLFWSPSLQMAQNRSAGLQLPNNLNFRQEMILKSKLKRLYIDYVLAKYLSIFTNCQKCVAIEVLFTIVSFIKNTLFCSSLTANTVL